MMVEQRDWGRQLLREGEASLSSSPEMALEVPSQRNVKFKERKKTKKLNLLL